MKTNKNLAMVIFALIVCLNSSKSQNYGAMSYFNFRHSTGLSCPESAALLNPAAMYLDSSSNLIFRTKPSRFGFSELSPMMISGVWRADSIHSLGMNLNGLGGSLYSEISSELRYSASLNDMITLGASLEYSSLSIKDYGNQSLVFANVGTVLDLSDELKVGFILRNIFGNYSEQADKTAYQSVVFGAGYRINEELTAEGDMIIIINSVSALSLALKYDYDEYLCFRAAYRTEPNIMELLVMYALISDAALMIGSEYHELFGFSPEIVLKYIF
ncbi:MAG: hypothetical protein WCZ17_00185 [Candidatus Kapaibacterium sp.]